jgi:predicted nucleic acid-binding protein
VIVVDTGPLYAAADSSDAHHAACSALFANPADQLVVTVSVVVETSFLIERHLGPAAEAVFLGSLAPAGDDRRTARRRRSRANGRARNNLLGHAAWSRRCVSRCDRGTNRSNDDH